MFHMSHMILKIPLYLFVDVIIYSNTDECILILSPTTHQCLFLITALDSRILKYAA